VLRRVRSADGFPAPTAQLFGEPCWLFDAHAASAAVQAQAAAAAPGAVLARRGPALLVRCAQTARVWLGHVRRGGLKPMAAGPEAGRHAAFAAAALPEWPLPLHHDDDEWDELRYAEFGPPQARVGWLEFDFHNGAMSERQCRRLVQALRERAQRPARAGAGRRRRLLQQRHPPARIEAAQRDGRQRGRRVDARHRGHRRRGAGDPDADRPLTVAALRGNAGAGGCFLALAADRCGRTKAWCSTRTTRTWATSTARSTGPTCCRAAWRGARPKALMQRPAADGAARPRPGPDRRLLAPTRRRFERQALQRALALAADPDLPARMRRQAAAPRRGRGAQAAGRLPRRGTGACTQLLRLRPQLPRGAPPLRAPQAARLDAAPPGAAPQRRHDERPRAGHGRRRRPLVLLVDDEVRSQEAMRRTLDEDFRILTASDADEARGCWNARRWRDPVRPAHARHHRREFLREVRERWPEAVRIVISGYTDSEDIIAGINEAGIFQYVLKPWVPDHLLQTVRNAVEAQPRCSRPAAAGHGPAHRHARAARQRGASAAQARAPSTSTASCARRQPAGRRVRHGRARSRGYDLSVLVLGESGTGKELLARAIHYASAAPGGPFVVENCAAIPDTLLESELFGHKRGAFTGAVEDHVGLFQRADGGTVFLDEIGETSPSSRSSCCACCRRARCGRWAARARCRSTCACSPPRTATWRTTCAPGRFREDLYYRIAGITLQMPPLRERPGDIVPIAERAAGRRGAELGRPGARFDRRRTRGADGLPLARQHPRAAQRDRARAGAGRRRPSLHARRLLAASAGTGQAGTPACAVAGSRRRRLPASGTLQERLDAIEAMVLREVMLRLRWNKTQAAQGAGPVARGPARQAAALRAGGAPGRC
jgi:two-component system response regulator HupR/HoxA